VAGLSEGDQEKVSLFVDEMRAMREQLSDMPTFRYAYRLSELPMPARFRPLFRD
jgi:hypothetical protein